MRNLLPRACIFLVQKLLSKVMGWCFYSKKEQLKKILVRFSQFRVTNVTNECAQFTSVFFLSGIIIKMTSVIKRNRSHFQIFLSTCICLAKLGYSLWFEIQDPFMDLVCTEQFGFRFDFLWWYVLYNCYCTFFIISSK